MAWNIQKTS